MKRFLLILLISCLATAIIIGCGTRYSRYHDLYSELKEELEKPDRSVLKGRIIVIDPGHGGSFRGAFGPDSLTEANVNLGTALYLWGLLKESGANVFLTRTTDRDFLDNDTELQSDLSNRIDYANSLKPEIFVSIHHNSNLDRDQDKNAIEVYYRETDPEASLALAREIHKHLARNLGIEQSCIKPGNYHVLRNSKAGAAVLGEASYMSNPVVEKKLKLSNKQRLEAEAYYLGLISYFARGIPRLSRITPPSDTIQSASEITYHIETFNNIPVDPSTVKIMVDGNEIETIFSVYYSNLIGFLKPDIPNGSYQVKARVGTVKGGITTSLPFKLTIDRPAAHIIALQPKHLAKGEIQIRLKVLDEAGQPVADGKPVLIYPLNMDEKPHPGPSIQDNQNTNTNFSLRSQCINGLATFQTEEELSPGKYIVKLPQLIDTISYNFRSSTSLTGMKITDAVSGENVSYPLVVLNKQEGISKTYVGDRDGTVFMDEIAAGKLVVSARGYRTRILELSEESLGRIKTGIKLSPLFKGHLQHVRIAIDPAGGGAAHDGMAENKLRGAEINLDTAKRLAGILRKCGANVIITRQGEENLSMEERIYKINNYHSEAAIRLIRGSGEETCNNQCQITHYPGSKGGTALADSIAEELSGMPPCGKLTTGESAEEFFSQTICTAVEIRFQQVNKRINQIIYNNPLYCELESEHIASAVIRYFAPDAEVTRLAAVLMNENTPVSNANICVDQIFSMQTNDEGCAMFNCLEPGIHMVNVQIPTLKPSVFAINLKGNRLNRTIFDISDTISH
jgi:N-acetylmuramoyl-L-alanine amidase